MQYYREPRDTDRFTLEEIREAVHATLAREGLLRSTHASMTVAGTLGLVENWHGDRFHGQVIRELDAMSRRGEAVKTPRGERRRHAVYRTPGRAAADDARAAEQARVVQENQARMDAIMERLAGHGIKLQGYSVSADDWEHILDAAGW